MAIQQQPFVGNWYVNLTGQLIKVVAVGYADGWISKVVIEHINGKRQILGIDTWGLLDLEMHLYNAVQQVKQQDL
ncbi:MAG: hypothetical protein HY940_05925 [Gammaproteobacteria bacterium]|nr:hypothetical protein [Gammaproteobacteria bacterium]